MGVRLTQNTAFLVMNKSIANSKEGIRRGLLEVGPEIEKEVVSLIRSPKKTGRLYWINGRLHQASAPGEAPANLTGALADSVDSKVTSPTRLLIGDIKSIAPYGGIMEHGTKDGTRILPRPHLRPGALNKAREVGQAIELGIKRQLGKI